MPEADNWARASEVNAHRRWQAADAGDDSDETAATARGFFLGQLPEDEPEDVWADEPDDVWADDPPDGEEELDPLATSFETEVHDPIATDDDATELSLASETDEPTGVATGAVAAVGARKADRVARKQRGKARLSRVAVVAGVVAALAAGTAVYVGTQAKADNQHASRPTSTSFERRSPSTTATTATTVAGSDPAPGTEPAPDTADVPGSAAPTSLPGTSSAPAPAPASAAPTSPRAPASTAPPPNTAAPPSPPPRSPTCQVLPVLCR